MTDKNIVCIDTLKTSLVDEVAKAKRTSKRLKATMILSTLFAVGYVGYASVFLGAFVDEQRFSSMVVSQVEKDVLPQVKARVGDFMVRQAPAFVDTAMKEAVASVGEMGDFVANNAKTSIDGSFGDIEREMDKTVSVIIVDTAPMVKKLAAKGEGDSSVAISAFVDAVDVEYKKAVEMHLDEYVASLETLRDDIRTLLLSDPSTLDSQQMTKREVLLGAMVMYRDAAEGDLGAPQAMVKVLLERLSAK